MTDRNYSVITALTTSTGWSLAAIFAALAFADLQTGGSVRDVTFVLLLSLVFALAGHMGSRAEIKDTPLAPRTRQYISFAALVVSAVLGSVPFAMKQDQASARRAMVQDAANTARARCLAAAVANPNLLDTPACQGRAQ